MSFRDLFAIFLSVLSSLKVDNIVFLIYLFWAFFYKKKWN